EAPFLLADLERAVGHVAVVLADHAAARLILHRRWPLLEGGPLALAEAAADVIEIVAHVAANARACHHDLSAPVPHGPHLAQPRLRVERHRSRGFWYPPSFDEGGALLVGSGVGDRVRGRHGGLGLLRARRHA